MSLKERSRERDKNVKGGKVKHVRQEEDESETCQKKENEVEVNTVFCFVES